MELIKDILSLAVLISFVALIGFLLVIFPMFAIVVGGVSIFCVVAVSVVLSYDRVFNTWKHR
jgi:hypothetical protein